MVINAWDMGERRDSIRCLLIPLAGRKMLLPSVAVAEVLPYAAVEPAADSPEWLLGTIEWRAASIPLLSFERLIGESPPEKEGVHQRVAVFHTLSEKGEQTEGPLFYGIVIQGIPHLIQLRESELTLLQSSPEDEPVVFRVEVQGQLAVIPNLPLLEERLAANHSR